MQIYYGVNNQVYANFNPLFGWCIYLDGAESFIALDYLPDVSSENLKVTRTLFESKTYPDDLRAAFDRAIAKAQAQEVLALKAADARYVAVMAEAEANAVSPIEVELADAKRQLTEAKTNEKYMLARLAMAHIGRLEQCFTRQDMLKRVRVIRAFLLDGFFELSLRHTGKDGAFLHYNDCQVTVKRPAEPDLVELLQDILPFTE